MSLVSEIKRGEGIQKVVPVYVRGEEDVSGISPSGRGGGARRGGADRERWQYCYLWRRKVTVATGPKGLVDRCTYGLAA
jgi:hypothetical protein